MGLGNQSSVEAHHILITFIKFEKKNDLIKYFDYSINNILIDSVLVRLSSIGLVD